ncbi:MAG: ATP-binding protein, partial [Actinobacteria bacterium]|nr:ATP-binding protein [Actinomycetota bacterium]
IPFLHDIVAVGGGFQEAVRRRGGLSRLRCLAARSHPDLVVKVRLGDNQNRVKWEYSVKFGLDERQRPRLIEETVIGNGVKRRRPDEHDREDPERLTQTHLEQVNVNKEFREVAEFFESVRYLHIVPQIVREPERYIKRESDPYGGDFLDQMLKVRKQTREARLKRIVEALKGAIPSLEERKLDRDARGTPHVKGRFEHWRSKGAWLTEDQFSDGTLRLIGLLWSLLGESGPLLLEEPELSLHPEVVRFIPQMMARVQRGQAGRQLLVSTHSSDLLRDEGIGLDELLLFIPDKEETKVELASGDEQVRALLEGGVSVADAVIPRTRPEKLEQLALFEG